MRTALISFTFFVGFVTAGFGQSCGFPWTVTATPAGPQTVAVHLCGTWVGCLPHNPQSSVSSGQINVTLTAAELPSCICTQSQIDVNQTVLVQPVSAGDYMVTATVTDCGIPIAVGTTSIAFSGGAAIPSLDGYGIAAFGLLLAGVGIWLLRSS